MVVSGSRVVQHGSTISWKWTNRWKDAAGGVSQLLLQPGFWDMENVQMTLSFAIGVSQNRGTLKWMVKIMENLLKWMIWGYPYFWKHPYHYRYKITQFSARTVAEESSMLYPQGGLVTGSTPSRYWMGKSTPFRPTKTNMGVSTNRGTPKSSI